MSEKIIITLVIISQCTLRVYSQDSIHSQWNKYFAISLGAQPFLSNWEYTHPSYSGSGGMQMLPVNGTYKADYFVQGGFELIKGYFGGGINVGFKPGTLNIEEPVTSYDFNVNYFNLSAMFLPVKLTHTVSPVIVARAGGVFCTGDLDNTGFFISLGVGTRIRLTDHFGMDLNLSGQRLQIGEVPLEPSITGDITNYVLNGSVSVYYKF